MMSHRIWKFHPLSKEGDYTRVKSTGLSYSPVYHRPLRFLSPSLFFFLGPHLQNMEIPGLGFELELQLLAYTTTMTAPDLSCSCDSCHSSRQRQIFNPLSKTRDQTHILMDISWVLNPLSHNRNSHRPLPFSQTNGSPNKDYISQVSLQQGTAMYLCSDKKKKKKLQNCFPKTSLKYCWCLIFFPLFFGFFLPPGIYDSIVGTFAATVAMNDHKNGSHIQGWGSSRIERAWVPNSVESYSQRCVIKCSTTGFLEGKPLTHSVSHFGVANTAPWPILSFQCDSGNRAGKRCQQLVLTSWNKPDQHTTCCTSSGLLAFRLLFHQRKVNFNCI